MKRITSLVLAIFMIAALLAGCGVEAPPVADSGSSGSDVAKIGDTTPPKSEAPPIATNSSLSGIVKTGGSTSVEKVMNALIYQFQDDNRDVTIDYEMNGSGDGIKNTLSGMYEIGHSSRELKTDGSEDGLDAIPYAIDGIAVIVNKANGVSNLTKDQIKGIFTGAVTNWKDVGGADALITVVTREAGSGTRSAFAEIIGLEKKDAPETDIVADATVSDSTGAVQTTVSQNPNAIGYMSFSDVDDSKVNALQYEGVEISVANLKNNSYGLKREFLLVVRTGETLSPEASAFIDFILSDEGQGIVADNKLVTIK